MPNISIYNTITDISSTRTIDTTYFLNGVKSGTWEDIIHPIRNEADPKVRSQLKKSAPSVTISGTFMNGRADSKITEHSGLIAIDFDAVDDVPAFKEQLSKDPYTYASFVSISGRGVCCIVKIDGSKHRQAFNGLCEYYSENFNMPPDPSGVNESRARFVSFDPFLFWNEGSVKFTKYKEPKIIRKLPTIVYAKNDFEAIIATIQRQNINIADGYHEYRNIGFALADKFGEEGRDYFHSIAQQSSKYTHKSCDVQYNHCLRAQGHGITIATLYYYAQQAGIKLHSEQTIRIATQTNALKKSGISKADIVKKLDEFNDIDPEISTPIVEQVYEQNINIGGNREDSIINDIKDWITMQYSLRRNIITGYIENNGRPLEDEDLFGLFVDAKTAFGNEAQTSLMKEIIHSPFVNSYNPFHEFFNSLTPPTTSDALAYIHSFWDCIDTPNKSYLKEFGTKWLVSIVASAFGQHSPLMLILVSEEQGTGKTEFFRRLLPSKLSKYYAESKLDRGKDDEILMTQRIIIMDDEMSGKSKSESARMKNMLSASDFSLRRPYGMGNVTLKRLAVLCATTNIPEVLSDPTGNRRYIPIRMNSYNFDKYNKTDKTHLFACAYQLWKEGFSWEISRDDAKRMEASQSEFKAPSIERELIVKYFINSPEKGYWVTATDIKVRLERDTSQKLRTNTIVAEMHSLGYRKTVMEMNGTIGNYYRVIEVGSNTTSVSDVETSTDPDLPF